MKIIIKIGIFFLNIFYALIKLFPTQNKIVFISRQSNSPSQDFKLLEKEINKQLKNYKVIMLTKTLDGGYKSKVKSKINYSFHMIKQMYHIATSKLVVLDSYCIVVSILKHKKKLKIVQIWHSVGTMKKFGYSILDKDEGSKKDLAEVMKMHKNYDYIFASSEAYKKDLAAGFNYQLDKIETYPLPRMDLLQNNKYKNKTVKSITKKYPSITKKENILYCPTFRKEEDEFEKNLIKLINNVDYDKYNLIIKLHPLSKVIINDDRVIFNKEYSTFDMLFVSDYVISDYSCIIYEAAFLNKPLFFYTFDMNTYAKKRDLYIDYNKEMPGLISGDVKKILESIKNKDYKMNKIKKFANKYIDKQKNYTKNIVKFFVKIINNP